MASLLDDVVDDTKVEDEVSEEILSLEEERDNELGIVSGAHPSNNEINRGRNNV
jgi:hypothetical protein